MDDESCITKRIGYLQDQFDERMRILENRMDRIEQWLERLDNRLLLILGKAIKDILKDEMKIGE